MLCSGSIIGNRTILTTELCVNKFNLTDLKVHAGTISLKDKGKVYSIKSVLIKNSIALLHLNASIVFNNTIRPIKLPTSNIDSGACNLIGWTRTEHCNNLLDNLQEMELDIYSYEKCKQIYPYIRKNIICAQPKGRDTCYDDLGAPLVANGTLIGIAHLTTKINPFIPIDGFLRIFLSTKWINENMGK
ncbi:chymotrypsin-1-like [Harpegnathos saltator]|uniref:chymotrypsin-1-like n=1 Tax=Harpegnathos saltator TaxID=610380 RepID=UPI00058FDF1E|nr:chymotrypsin-1-like [Harpegnathos saltator]